MKTPYLSTKPRFLLLIIAALLFGFNQTAHAEGLSGLKDILNKGKINKSNAPDVPIIPDTVKSSDDLTPIKNKRIIDDSVKTPEFIFVNKNRIEGKVNLTKNKKETSEKFSKDLINDCNKMLASLKSTEKKKTGPVIAAVRIEDDLDGSIPSQLPEDFFKNIDTDELAIRTDIKNLYDSFEALSLVDFNKTCESLLFRYRNSRADICHLISLIKSDAQLKKDPNSALEKQTIRKLIWPTHFDPIPPYPRFDFFSLYEQYLKINRDTSFGNELTKFVNKEADIRLKKIKKANDNIFPAINNEINSLNKLKADYEAYIKKLLSLKHILPGFTADYENNSNYLQRVMKYAIDDIKSYYLKISQAYIKIAIVLNAAGQWEESLKLTEEYKDYFDKNMPYKFTIKLAGLFDYDAAANSGNLGNLKIIEGDLLINKDNLLWGEKRMDQAAFECVSRLSLQNVTDQLNGAELRNKIIKFAETNITDAAEIKEYKIESTVERIYFTENEYSDSINPKKIFDADERICIKVVLDTYNRFYQRPIEITLKSSVSGRNKIVKTTPQLGYGLYYALFQPNETQDPSDSTKNLIETDPRQMNPEPLPDYPDDEFEPPSGPQPPAIAAIKLSSGVSEPKQKIKSISVAQCEIAGPGMALKRPPSIYNNVTHECYFNKQLVRSYIKQETEDVVNKIAPNSKAFLMSGGAEYVDIDKIKPDDQLVGKSKILVKRVANCFIIQGHGSSDPADNAIGEKKYNSVAPMIDLCYPSSSGKQYSEYEGMDILILDTCYNLCGHKFRGWRKVLPRGVVMGYYGQVNFAKMNKVLDMLSKEFEKKSDFQYTKEELGKLWAKYNTEVYNASAVKFLGTHTYGYIIPHPTEPDKNIYYSGKEKCDKEDDYKYYAVPGDEIEF